MLIQSINGIVSNEIFCVFIAGHGFEHGRQDQPFSEDHRQRTVEDWGFCESDQYKGFDIGKLYFDFLSIYEYLLLYDIFWLVMFYVQVI